MNDLFKARRLLNGGEYTCVFVRGDEICGRTQNGIAPLLDLISEGVDLKGFSAADKIVGKAAALLYVKMGVAAVYAQVLSFSALEILRDNDVEFYCDSVVGKINNRSGCGICPMEAAVEEIFEPEAAYAALVEAFEKLVKS